MAASQETIPDRISASDPNPIDSRSKLTISTAEVSVSAGNAKEQDEEAVPSDGQQEETPAKPPRNIIDQPGNPNPSLEQNAFRPPNIYTPQAQTIYYGGYGNASGDWDEYFQYVNHEGLELGSPSVYSESPSLLFHTGYGYNPQVPYGPYSPATPPLPPSRGDSQLYSPQQFPVAGHYYQQPLPPNLSFLNSPTPISQTDQTVLTGVEHQGALLSDNSSSNSMLSGPKPEYPSQGAFGRSNFSGNSGNPAFYDLRQGYDGFGSVGPWSDWLKSPDAQKSFTPLYSTVASPQPISTHGPFVHNVNAFASGPAPHQQRPFYGFGSSISSSDRGYMHGGVYNQGPNFGANLGTNGRGWVMNDKGRRRWKGDTSLYSNGTLDFLSEQSRGPRATRPKNLNTDSNSSDGKNRNHAAVDQELYNKPGFIIEYKDAKFFIIKSYSEDNVHKSIKYGVWASTPNGNKKLDAAYREAKEKGGACPVFLFFSVNSSAQFCGVAEMTGPVDFEKSVDYWQQDKWSGQFPVKWHIVKDVPNSSFRHIILANNDSKPVTNSRDTQEVKLEQGLEMLGLFKEHDCETSILDDFDFYEERQKAMEERKALQQQQSHSAPAYPPTSTTEQRHPLLFSGNIASQMSKNFTHVVRLDEISKENVTATEKDAANTDANAGDKSEPRIAESG